MIKLKNILEGIELPVKIGDTILMGKFKNKKVVVKPRYQMNLELILHKK